MAVTAQMVKELRERTGAPMMDCKNSLEEVGGDIEKAIDSLRTKGLAKAAKKSGRATAEGLVGSYIHAGGRIGVMVEINCETDFVARTDDFAELVGDVAMHIAAADPKYVSRDEVTTDDLDRERVIFRQQALDDGKPENIVDKIVEGKISKYYSECCLLEQTYVKDSDLTVQELLTAKIAILGENMLISRFSRFTLGGAASDE